MVATLILWGHALAALSFAALALWTLRGGGSDNMPRKLLAAALAMTALWALAVAGIGEDDVVTYFALGGRNLLWLAFMFVVQRRGAKRPPAAIGTVYGVLAAVILVKVALHIDAAATPSVAAQTLETTQLLGMMVALASLVLVQALYTALAPARRGGLHPIVLAMAAMWLVDANLLSIAYLTSKWPESMAALRGIAMTLIALAIAAGLQRRDDWPMQISRTVAYQSLTLVAVGLYLAVLALATTAIAAVGGSQTRLLQTAFVFGSTTAMLTLVSSNWLRAWIKVKLAKHFFRHRYDYRTEWLRFTETLGQPEDDAPLDERIVKALADLTESPGGVLLVPHGDTLTLGATWNIDRDTLPTDIGEDWPHAGVDPALILELDGPVERETVPPSIRAWEPGWVVVPLVHHTRLVGMILLARPLVPRALDWEDFDLLKAAGRQLASYIAEERAQAALAEAQRFDEFNRRFAFIMHDIKNLVSQLTLVARNAERHADNPAFRADMVATLHDSAGRMNDMLARLSQHHAARGSSPVATPIVPLVRRIARARRAQHQVEVNAVGDPMAIVEPSRLETLLGHLLQNAIEASATDSPITINVRIEGEETRIEVIDHGSGMSPAFVREKLFKPFVSSKPGGFGLGAFEAQKLAEEMGGRIEVESAEGRGTRFSVLLRTAGGVRHEVEQAA